MNKNELKFERAVVNFTAAAEGEKTAPRRFTINAYTGGAMRVGFGLPVVIDLAGMRRDSGPKPVLKDHSEGQIVGHTESVTISATSITVTGVVSGVGDAAAEVVGTSLAGFPWQASIGASVEWASMDEIKAGAQVTVNGRTLDGPLYVARASVLREVSFVALGADENTTAAVAAKHKEPRMKFADWITAQGFDVESMNDTQRATLKAAFDAEQVKAAPAVEVAKVEAKADGNAVADVRAEFARVGAIERIAASSPDIKAKAITEGWTPDATELAVLRASRPTAVKAKTSNENDPKESAIIECAALRLAGVSDKFLESQYDKRTIDAATQKSYQRMTPHAIIGRVLASAGESVNFGRVDDDTLRAALAVNVKASAFTSLSLPGILSAVSNKVMLESFEAVPTTVDQWCAQVPVSDFKTVNMYRLGGSGIWKKVAQDGELTNGILEESAYTAKAETYGQILTITRQTLKNDDLGAMLKLPRLMGRGAAIARENAAFSLLITGATASFFSTGNKNNATGAGSVLSIAGLTAAEKLMLDQTANDGSPIMLMPNRIMVPTALKVTAETLYTATTVNETTTANAGKPNTNPHSSKYRPIASPFLNSGVCVDEAGKAVSGGSDTQWFLTGDPSVGAAVNIVYVDGQRQPTIEQGEPDFNTLGIAMRGFWDFGVGRGDPRTMVRNAGA